MINTDRELNIMKIIEPLVKNIETLNQLVASQKATIEELEKQLKEARENKAKERVWFGKKIEKKRAKNSFLPIFALYP